MTGGVPTAYCAAGGENHIPGAQYDSDGNLISDPVTPANNVNQFDAQGRPAVLEGASVLYDALGRAVEAGGKEILYAPGGAKLAIMSGQSLQRADVPLPGGAEAAANGSGNLFYRHADRLGSSRLTTTPGRTLYAATAYGPYGGAFNSSGAADRSFTGQKQDIDSTHSGGQYDFLMRHPDYRRPNFTEQMWLVF